MIKNGLTSLSLLGLLLIFLMSACSAPRYSHANGRKSYKSTKKYASHYKKRPTKTRNTKRVEKVATIDKIEVRSQIVKSAEKYLGVKYVYGGKTPSPGFDCSGFTSWVFDQNGIDVKGASHHQSKLGKKISKSKVNPGDLIFFGSGTKVSHVAIVKANDGRDLEVIHATSSAGVTVDEINNSDYWNKRYLYARQVIQ